MIILKALGPAQQNELQHFEIWVSFMSPRDVDWAGSVAQVLTVCTYSTINGVFSMTVCVVMKEQYYTLRVHMQFKFTNSIHLS